MLLAHGSVLIDWYDDGFGDGFSSAETLFTATTAKGVLQLQQYKANFPGAAALGVGARLVSR